MADSNWSVRIGTRVTDDIQKQLNAMPKKTVQVKAVLDTTGLKTIGTTELTKYEDTLGNIVTTSKKFDATGKELNNTIRSVKSTIDTTSQTLQTASKHTKTLGQDFVETAGKVAKFGAITAILGLVTTAIGSAVKSVKELDSAMVEFNKVSNLSGSGLDNYTKKLGELGLEVARTKEEMVEASTEFVKAGYTEEESAKLAKTASLFQNVADAELSASEASTVLISNMKAFGMTSADSERVVDVINEVSNVFAVSSSDISAGLSKTASAMSTLGNTYEQSIALMVGAGEQMPNQSGKIARGLRSIGLEMVKVAQQSKTIDTGYQGVTLSLYDENDALKSTYEIMSDLYPTWTKMTDQQKSNLGVSLAGKQQYEVFSATMEGFSQVLKANEVGLNAMGSAMKENEAYMDGIEAKTKLLKAQFDLLVNGDGGLNSFIKGLLDGATLLLNFANDTKMLNIALVDLGIILTATLLPKFASLASMIYTTIGVFALEVVQTKSLSAGFQYLAVSASTAKIAVGSLVAVLTIGMLAYNKYKASQEELARLSDEQSEKLSKEAILIQDKLKKISDETTSREQLVDAIKSVNSAYDEEKLAQKDINELRQEGIDLLSEEAKERANASLLQMSSDINEANMGLTGTGENFKTSGVSGINPSDYFQYSSEAIYGNKDSFYGSDLAGTVSGLEAYGTALRELKDDAGTNIEQQQIIQKELDRVSEKYTELKGNLDVFNATKEQEAKLNAIVNGTYEELYDEQGNLKNSTDDAKSSLSDYEQALQDLDATLSILSGTTISGLSDAFSLLKNAQEEINDTGSLSIDTYESLMDLGAEYQAILFDENGQLRLNEESITAVYNAKIDEMAITSARNMVDLAGQLSDEGKSFADLANDTNSATVAGWEQVAVMMAELELSEKDSKALQARIDGIKQWAEEAKKSVGSYNGVAKSASKASSATDKLQSSVESLLKEHLSDEIDKLKKAEESEIKVLKKRITLLEKNRDTQLDSIDAQIDGIEKLQDAEESRIDNEISQLEKQKSAVEDYYDAQISALKKANTERERQIKLMQLEEALARAKSSKVMVMTDAGWQHGQDESAVASAEQNLSDYQSELSYTTQIEQLETLKASAIANIDSQIAKWEEYKTTMQNNYASQILALETYRTTVEQSYATQIETLEGNIETIQEQYDLQIEQLETFKDNVDEFVEGLSQAEQRRLESQLNQIKSTASNYETDLNNLKEYVNKFNAILAQKGSAGATVSTGTSVGSSTANSQKTRGYASGVASVGSSQVAMIGDDPNNRELVIGSKLNGTATMLSQGSGVVNAQSTKTLAGILNTLGSSMGLNGQTMGMSTVNNSNANSQSISIGNITLPSVTNAQSFVDELKGFSSNMVQYAYGN